MNPKTKPLTSPANKYLEFYVNYKVKILSFKLIDL